MVKKSDKKDSHLEESQEPVKKQRGGSKPGERRGGRQKGAKNKRTKFREDLVNAALITGEDPLSFFMNIYKNTDLPLDIRMKAAGEALPYVHRKMPTAMEMTGADKGPIDNKLEVVFINEPKELKNG